MITLPKNASRLGKDLVEIMQKGLPFAAGLGLIRSEGVPVHMGLADAAMIVEAYMPKSGTVDDAISFAWNSLEATAKQESRSIDSVCAIFRKYFDRTRLGFPVGWNEEECAEEIGWRAEMAELRAKEKARLAKQREKAAP